MAISIDDALMMQDVVRTDELALDLASSQRELTAGGMAILLTSRSGSAIVAGERCQYIPDKAVWKKPAQNMSQVVFAIYPRVSGSCTSIKLMGDVVCLVEKPGAVRS